MCFNDYTFRLIPGGSEQDTGNPNLALAKKVITIIFISECALKVLAMGFLLGHNSYLSDSWNKMDFIVVVIG